MTEFDREAVHRELDGMFLPDAGNDPAAKYDAFLDKFFDRREKALAPVWAAQTEWIRSIVSLSSGAIVLTVSLVQILSSRGVHPSSRWLLPASLISFGVAVVYGVSTHGLSARVHMLRAFFEKDRDVLLMVIRFMSSGQTAAAIREAGKLGETIDTIIGKHLSKADAGRQDALKAYGWRARICEAGFLFGIVFLLLFAIRNLPI